MSGMSKFQLILTGVFGAFIVIGVLVFSFARTNSKLVSNIVVWGTIPQEVFDSVLYQSAIGKDKTLSIRYVAKNEATFDTEFIEALASGTGPDAVMLPQEGILKNRSKLFTIPYASYPERNFKDSFIEEAELFLTPGGVLAVPLFVDPLVMYWNRDMFNNASLPKPPAFWDEFYDLSGKLTTKDGALNITKATVAFGGWKNVSNAKAIMSALLMQAGSPVVSLSGTQAVASLTQQSDALVTPANAALTFYSEFSNPAKPFYSWNPSLPNSQSMFISGDLATYMGFASEINSLRLKNPNLNFDVSALPQSRGSANKITFGRMEAFAIVKTSKNIPATYSAIIGLVSSDSALGFHNALKVPPARRDLLSQVPNDPYASIFYNSALWARGWLDLNQKGTDGIFQKLIESITSGRLRLEVAIAAAQGELQNLLQQEQK